jgi:2OG-Fe(II) oxygenase superfamily
MTKSNPPEVSLEASKLWPLPLLSLLAGIPPIVKLLDEPFQHESIALEQALSVMLPPIALALCATIALAYGVVLPTIQKLSSTSSRTSEATAFNLEEDVVFCRDFVDRVSQYTRHPWYAWEAPVVTRYEPGAVFARHGDASPTRGTEWADMGGQRVITCICYLNTLDVGQGGETYFDQLGLHVSPKAGDALVFFPADPATLKADPRTTHESLPPAEEKWIVQMFGRIGPRVPPPLGLPDSFGPPEQQQTPSSSGDRAVR